MKHMVIVAPLEPLTVGESFVVPKFPLHMTLLPPFRVECDWLELSAVVEAIADGTGCLVVDVVGQEGFGPGGGIMVSLVRATDSLLNVHLGLTEALRPLGWTAQEADYNGSGFRPHITGNNEEQVLRGQHFILGEMAIVEMLDLPTVRATYQLSGEGGPTE
ncbi:hypothetical protein E3T55_11615 [Cryobacterium frigoriphilum]|uniref:2'-5' RNA ligase family protein n=1 Tax=Cryobacterium frigoriphilum TaxID=1259150 RepID=A0A4R8ZZ75_9MICO|nr:hypothetical protein [Cryobacterium frigoriphilum]TFD49300.1 hypothetical protein E3T55_11615 [Cryobacterium frigoriphilum]